MTTTATFMAEFRSCMTFKCKTAMAAPTDVPNTPNAEFVSKMTPQQQAQQMQSTTNDCKPPQTITELERPRDMHHSPGSSPGTSLASSPALPMESASIISNGINHEFAIRDPNLDDPSSDDSESMPNDLSGYNGDQDEMPSPLTMLQCSLEKNGMLGKKLDHSSYPSSESDPMVRECERNGLPMATEEHNTSYDGCGEIYKCHLCSYTGNSKFHFNNHMNTHFDHKCPFCDYTSRTEGRLKRHVKDFHSETPPDSWAGTRVPRADGSGGELSMDDSVSSSGNGKSRTYRCKQCDFVAYRKNDFWDHNKTHIKAEKLLTCPQCAFVTEYKHHLEYHIRNHFGSKPFKCAKCNYSCVNKSMLNSHMKSHSNVYQYRCANCSYATKYCHSLKLHLRKYEHKPASVLNMDGTPNPYPIIDVYGTRRGPRPKKRKFSVDNDNRAVSSSALVPSQNSLSYSPVTPLLPSNVPVMYSSQFFNGYHNNIFMRPPLNGDGYGSIHPHNNPHFGMKHSNPVKCLLCDFVTEHQEVFHKHMLLHAASENQDLIKLYGISSEAIVQMQEQQMAASYLSLHGNRQIRENGIYNFDTENKCIKLTKMHENSHIIDSTYSALREKNEFEYPERQTVNGNRKTPPEVLEKQPQVELSIPSFLPRYNGFQNMADEVSNTSRSVIVSHKSASPHSPISPHQRYDSQPNSPPAEKVEEPLTEYSPLDLSNGKSNDSRSPIPQKELEEASRSPKAAATANIASHLIPTAVPVSTSVVNSCNSSQGVNSSQMQPRNRRKGKAFKIDRYLHYDDQSSPPDVVTESSREPRNVLANYTHASDILSLTVKNGSNDEKSKASRSNLTPDATIVPVAVNNYPSQLQQHRKSPEFLNEPAFQSSATVPKIDSGSPLEKSTINEQRLFPISSAQRPVADHSSPDSSIETHKKVLHHSQTPNFPKTQAIEYHYPVPAVSHIVPKTEQDFVATKQSDAKWQDAYMCTYCDMAFRDCVMYTMHMGYHGYADPYTCNMCGHESKDKVDFFLHIARAAHM